ncbi:MAG: NAD+ synthase [Candidatus Diapherotrites archaeon]
MFESNLELLRLKQALKDFFALSSCTGIALGFSGGVDSAVCLKLLVDSIRKEKIIVLLMPEKKNKITSECENYCNELGVKYFVIELNSLISSFSCILWKESFIANANLKARLRMLLLYHYTNSNNFLVCGTGNKSELMLGYFTKFGDGANDFLPLGSLYKTQVIELAKELNVPKKFIERIPSAGLWENQTDEKELGANYELIDEILINVFDKNISFSELKKKKKFPEKILLSLEKRINSNKHKISLPKIL